MSLIYPTYPPIAETELVGSRRKKEGFAAPIQFLSTSKLHSIKGGGEGKWLREQREEVEEARKRQSLSFSGSGESLPLPPSIPPSDKASHFLPSSPSSCSLREEKHEGEALTTAWTRGDGDEEAKAWKRRRRRTQTAWLSHSPLLLSRSLSPSGLPQLTHSLWE